MADILDGEDAVEPEEATMDASKPIRIPPVTIKPVPTAGSAQPETQQPKMVTQASTEGTSKEAWRFDIKDTGLKAVVAGRTIGGPKHLTHKGNQLNDDTLLVDPSIQLLAVFDGVSNSEGPTGDFRPKGGRLASAYAKDALDAEYRISGNLEGSVNITQDRLLAEVRREGSEVGSTTLTAVSISGGTATFSNVGDSPSFLIRGGKVTRVGHLDNDPKEPTNLSQCLGNPEKAEIVVNTSFVQIEKGDYIVLGTDGVEKLALTAQEANALALDPTKAKRVAITDYARQKNPDRTLAFDIDVVLEALAKEGASPQDIVEMLLKSAAGTDDKTAVVAEIQ